MTDNPALTEAVRRARAACRCSRVSVGVIAARATALMILHPVHVETQP
jgi:hypothetical protein